MKHGEHEVMLEENIGNSSMDMLANGVMDTIPN
jgi:hypothetical protein